MITKTALYLLSKVPDRYLKKININSNGCWEWQGDINGTGYGRLYFMGARIMSHRFMYELLKEPIPDGNILEHH